MPGLSLTLETAKSTLLNTQVQIQVTSHNIANAENKSYARQKAILGTNPPNLVQGVWMGTGASVESVTQMRSVFIEQRLMSATSGESGYKTLSTQIAIAQATFSDNGNTGISQALGAFWDSWDVLTQNPQGLSEQTGVYAATDRLAHTIRTTYEDLNTLANSEESGIPKQIQDGVDKANGLLKQIADLNRRISENETPGHQANDLRDLRYQALKDLAEIMPFQFIEEANGSITIRAPGGSDELVSGAQVAGDPLQYDAAAGEITFTAYGGATSTTDSLSGGSLGGLLTARNDTQAYMGRLNDFAATLISGVNAIYNPAGDLGQPFVFMDGGDASNIDMSPDFLNGQDPAVLSDRALTISSLQDETVGFPGGTSAKFAEYLGDIQRQIGLDHQDAQAQAGFQEALRMEIDSQQQSVSGVSLDEEMVELLKHQQIYQAAAKIIQQTVEMLNHIIDIT